MGTEKQDFLGDVNRGENRFNSNSLFQAWGILNAITGVEKSRTRKKKIKKDKEDKIILRILNPSNIHFLMHPFDLKL